MTSNRLSGTMKASRFWASTIAPYSSVPLRQRHGLGEVALGLRDRGPKITPTHAVFQRYEALAVLAIDVGRAALEFHLRDVAQRDIGGGRFRIVVRYRDRHGADGADVIAIPRSQSGGQCEIHLAFVHARDFLSANRGLHDRVDVADRDAITRCLRAIYADNQIRLAD